MGEGENRKSPQRALPRNKGGEGVGAYPVSDLPIAGGKSRVYHRRERGAEYITAESLLRESTAKCPERK